MAFTPLVDFGVWYTVPSEPVPITDGSEPETLSFSELISQSITHSTHRTFGLQFS